MLEMERVELQGNGLDQNEAKDPNHAAEVKKAHER